MHTIQIAKNHFDAKRIVVTSSQVELCKSLGADEVINYKETEWEKELKDANFDVIIDVMGGKKSWTDCKEYNVLAAKGKYVTVAGDFDDDVISCCQMCTVMCCVLGRKCCSSQEYHMVNQDRSRDIEKALELVVDGKVKVVIDEEAPYALDDYLKLYEKSIARKAHGKMILKFYDEKDAEEVVESNEKKKTTVEEEEQKHEEEEE